MSIWAHPYIFVEVVKSSSRVDYAVFKENKSLTIVLLLCVGVIHQLTYISELVLRSPVEQTWSKLNWTTLHWTTSLLRAIHLFHQLHVICKGIIQSEFLLAEHSQELQKWTERSVIECWTIICVSLIAHSVPSVLRLWGKYYINVEPLWQLYHRHIVPTSHPVCVIWIWHLLTYYALSPMDME